MHEEGRQEKFRNSFIMSNNNIFKITGCRYVHINHNKSVTGIQYFCNAVQIGNHPFPFTRVK
jgi:hypothetical protein